MRSLNLIAAAALAAFALAAQAQQAPAQMQKTAVAAADQPQAAAKADAATIKAAFKRADTNSDGKLSREEATALPAVAEKFTQIDKDGDGFISADEFEAGVGTAAQPAQK